MTFEFLASVVAALGCAGFALLLCKPLPGLTKCLITLLFPFAAAVGPIRATARLGYEWRDRAMPAGARFGKAASGWNARRGSLSR